MVRLSEKGGRFANDGQQCADLIYVLYPKRIEKIDPTTIRLVDNEFECWARLERIRNEEVDIGQGIESLATFDLKSSELDFGTAFTWADQNQSGGGSDSGFSMIDIGLNSRWPTDITVFDRKYDT